jgi:hypothetical protein
MEKNMTDYFEIRDLPCGRYTVSWEYPNMVSSPNKLARLADIVFDTVGSDVLALALQTVGGGDEYVEIHRWDYLGNCDSFCENYSHYYIITGCRLATRDQAECLVREFEKRLMWKRLQRTN